MVLCMCTVHSVLRTFTVCRSIPFGTRQGLVECEYQFRNDRWNCTDNRSPQVLQSTLERGELGRLSLEIRILGQKLVESTDDIINAYIFDT